MDENMYLIDLFGVSHDAILSGFFYYKGNILTIYIDLESEVKYKLTLYGVVEFRVVEFGMQNVVSRMIEYKGHSVKYEDVIGILKWVSSSSDSSIYWSDKQMFEIFGKIKKNTLSLIYVEPSVGCECAFLFENYSIEEI
ncbi:hypothetical protein [Acinetobacter calcoaceticus]|uniref:hypothetical protein n=1 Tax=Acinetobacter calcoaceticus TaxID=471 RepID=UPI0030095A12